jgi:1-deoxy-D-xylulose-5-phosphate synthase
MIDLLNIKDPDFLKDLDRKELIELSSEIRTFLIEKISKTGGHLSSNLGIVELTVALHKVFDSPKDKFIFDVGHQGYVHKILTGRAKDFDKLRQFEGLSGFLKREESVHDIYEAGHSSTSIAAASGIEFSKKFTKEEYRVIPIVGDGALTSGMAFEALNFLGGKTDHNPIIILNDNEMSISQNIGYLANILNEIKGKSFVRKVRSKTYRILPRFLVKLSSKVERGIKGFISNNTIFDDLGFSYYGPINGHDYKELLKYLTIAKKQKKPCVVHVITQKGKGYSFSENDKLGVWHGVGPFNIETGKSLIEKKKNEHSWSTIISEYMCEYASKNQKFNVVIPAMIAGSGFIKFREQFPSQITDVGIAEQMAVTMSSGFALEKVDVFTPIYSTFIQRAYDQVNHDVCRQNLKVIFGIDRAGIVGADGETHQGVFDIPLLRHLPNLKIVHPSTPKEAFELLNYAFKENDGPIVIRYERGTVEYDFEDGITNEIATLEWKSLNKGEKATFISFGSILNNVEKDLEKMGVEVVNAISIKPLDEVKLLSIAKKNTPIIVYEESALLGGFGSSILEFYAMHGIQTNVTLMGIKDAFVPQGTKEELLQSLELDPESVIRKVKSVL